MRQNVKNYFATLATGEKRRFFKPIAGHRLNVVDAGETKAWIVPMPGHHSDTAKNDNNVGKIVFNLAYRFLNACQTPVPAMRHYMLGNLAAWKLYEQIMVGDAEVHTTGKAGKFFMRGVGYTRSSEASAHNFGESFFPNVHARKLMAAAFPVLNIHLHCLVLDGVYRTTEGVPQLGHPRPPLGRVAGIKHHASAAPGGQGQCAELFSWHCHSRREQPDCV